MLSQSMLRATLPEHRGHRRMPRYGVDVFTQDVAKQIVGKTTRTYAEQRIVKPFLTKHFLYDRIVLGLI